MKRLNTSPARSRRSAIDTKSSQKQSLVNSNNKNGAKGAFKRNLFGENEKDQTAAVLAKDLLESPQLPRPCSVLHDTAIQSIQCSDFNYKRTPTEESRGESKNLIYSV